MVGDFVLQTRWQAADKLEDRMVRFDHCVSYLLPFLVVVLATGHDWRAFYAFPVCLFALHFLTDSRRFHSTLGDVVGWKMGHHAVEVAVVDTQGFPLGSRVDIGGISGRVTGVTQAGLVRNGTLHVETAMPPPNPWTPIPILIDQTLHVCQLALLGGIFLS